MSVDNFPKKQIDFTNLFDGFLKESGIEAEVKDEIGKLIAPNKSVAVVRRDEDGWAEFPGKMPPFIRATIAREYDVDIPFIMPETHVVAKAPNLDAEFNIAFLTAGRNCDRLKDTNRKPAFRKLISRVEAECTVSFAEAANAFLRKAHRHDGAFFLDIKNSSWSEMFMMMASMGFFRRVDRYYQMVIPRQPAIDIMSEALILLLETRDDHGLLHPERHLVTMTHYSAKYHRKRLRKAGRDEPPNEQEPAVTLVPEV